MDYLSLPHTFLPVASVNDPKKNKNPSIYAFEGDHCALVYAPETNNPLVRIHSECLTGDVFGSRKCDCGDQLRQAQAMVEKEGGIILYLRQEGRGHGLFEKIKAYELQDEGMDTFESGQKLGHQDDARDYQIAIQMLQKLDIKQCRLMTNNLEKQMTLTVNNIEVTQVIPMPATINPHNEKYIQAKIQNGHKGLKPR